MIAAPETQYAKTADRSHIAYQVIGDGPLDLLYLPGAGGKAAEGPRELRDA